MSHKYNQQSGVALKPLLIAMGILALMVLIAIPVYQNLKTKSLQAEAKVILSYISTLESAHSADTGEYIFFDEYYGSPMKGKDSCERPKGAVELGFLLRNCSKDPHVGGLRYAYRIEPVEDKNLGFKAVAVSGSDLNDGSFVCPGVAVVDKWYTNADKNYVREIACK
jgi:hypothetical protein